jgi:VanZ like family.
MQRRANMQASSLIILLSILTILVQFIGYYLFEPVFVIWAISCIASALCSYIIQERTITYNSCFYYSILTLFMSLIFIVSTFGNNQSVIPYSGAMLGIAVINWLVPSLSGYIRHMIDYGAKLEDYTEFFRNSSIVFLLFYAILLIYGSFVTDAFPWAYRDVTNSANFMPFQIITTQLDNYYLDGSVQLSDIFTYLIPRILIYSPFGFYVGLAFHKRPLWYKLVALLSLPFLLELLQYFIINKRCDIDDLIYALIGGALGALFFFLTNLVSRTTTGKDFLKRDTGLRYIENLLHF